MVNSPRIHSSLVSFWMIFEVLQSASHIQVLFDGSKNPKNLGIQPKHNLSNSKSSSKSTPSRDLSLLVETSQNLLTEWSCSCNEIMIFHSRYWKSFRHKSNIHLLIFISSLTTLTLPNLSIWLINIFFFDAKKFCDSSNFSFVGDIGEVLLVTVLRSWLQHILSPTFVTNIDSCYQWSHINCHICHIW